MTNADLAFFKEHGYFFTPPVFTDAELDRVKAAQDLFYEGKHDPWPFKKVPIVGWTPDKDPDLRKNDFAQIMIPELRELILNPKLGAWAKFLCGESVRLFQDQLSYKAPRDSASKTSMGWHNDRQYWSCCSSTDMLTAWVPLEDTEVEVGPIMFMDRSHKWPDLPGMDFFSHDLEGPEAPMKERGLEMKRVPAILKKGQISFHHCRTLHASAPNFSDHPRRAVAIHLQPVSNRPVPNKVHIVKILMSELGAKSFDHPLLFPLLGGQE